MEALDHRRARACLRLTGEDGAPLSGARVRVDQTGHQFLFGCGAFDAIAMTMAKTEEEKTFFENRLEKWLALFNYGTLPFYWGQYEPQEGRTAYAETMAAARWLRGRGARVKGHPLCWHTVCAPWLLKYSNAQIFDRQIARVHRETEAYRGVVELWDVINEAVIMPDFDRYDNAVTRICRDRGRLALVKAVFEAAKESSPDAVLLINDFNTGEAYAQLIEQLLDAGVPIGAIGIQSHQHQGYWGLEKLQAVLNRFSHFGLPLHFTENTLVSGELMPAHIVDLNDWQVDAWPSTPEGEERQAREMAEMYRTLFSHPLVRAVTAWDFCDGGWLKAPSGLMRADGSLKPAYEALGRLIHGEWETHETLTADGEGRVAFTGFLGEYAVQAAGQSASFSLHGAVDCPLRLQKQSEQEMKK